jgi:hypothetical protein
VASGRSKDEGASSPGPLCPAATDAAFQAMSLVLTTAVLAATSGSRRQCRQRDRE